MKGQKERVFFSQKKGRVKDGAVGVGGVTYMRRPTAIFAACILPHRLDYLTGLIPPGRKCWAAANEGA